MLLSRSMDDLNNENACDAAPPAAKQVLRCKAPKKGRHRLEPSIAFPFRCEGCGYHFRSMANLRDHQKGFMYAPRVSDSSTDASLPLLQGDGYN
jgi:hypothetical protein